MPPAGGGGFWGLLERLVVGELPRYLSRVVGEREAAAILGRLGWRVAVEELRGLRVGGGPGGVVEFFRVGGGHPLGVVEGVEARGEGAVVLRLSGRVDGLAVAGLVAGVIAGALTAAGYESYPLLNPAMAFHLCARRRVDYIVYPGFEGGRWTVTVQRSPCSKA